MANKDIYTVIHEHKHGISVYVVKSDHSPTENEAVEKLGIDFEPDNPEEYIHIDGPMDIIKI